MTKEIEQRKSECGELMSVLKKTEDAILQNEQKIVSCEEYVIIALEIKCDDELGVYGWRNKSLGGGKITTDGHHQKREGSIGG